MFDGNLSVLFLVGIRHPLRRRKQERAAPGNNVVLLGVTLRVGGEGKRGRWGTLTIRIQHRNLKSLQGYLAHEKTSTPLGPP